jgi:pimeloyl-ACP methyl ester carboxylesterase/NAD(P)-dependent dehydrogenase (short-subunit alcohol dehydrogenase family)
MTATDDHTRSRPRGGSAPGRAAGLRVLVTGAAGGIGGAARDLLELHGARVVGLDLAPGRAGDVVADVRDATAVEKAVTEAVTTLGGLDVVVNAAGLGDPVDVGAMPDETVTRLLDVNLLGTWRVTSAALPSLLDTGGRVVCLASGLAYASLPFASAYAVSKRGVAAYADALRLEYGDRVAVTTLYPGYIATGIHASSEAAGLHLGEVAPAESLDHAARAVLAAAVGRPRRDVALTGVGAGTLAVSRHVPRLLDRVVRGRTRALVRQGRLGRTPGTAVAAPEEGPTGAPAWTPPGAGGDTSVHGADGETTTVPAADGVPLHVEEHGPADAGTTVVLVHGWLMATHCWHRQVPALAAAGARVLAYDHRGHGASGATPPERATIDQLADDLAAVVDARAPQGRLVLVGHSMGGMTLMALAERHPHLLASRDVEVVLMSTTAGRVSEASFCVPAAVSPLVHRALPAQLAAQAAAERRGRDLVPAPVLRGIVRRSAFGRRPRREDVALVADLVAATPADAAAAFHRALAAHRRHPGLDALRDVPVTLLTGVRDGLCPTAHTHEIAAVLPHARLHTYPDAGHMLMLERAGDVTGVLTGRVRAA